MLVANKFEFPTKNIIDLGICYEFLRSLLFSIINKTENAIFTPTLPETTEKYILMLRNAFEKQC